MEVNKEKEIQSNQLYVDINSERNSTYLRKFTLHVQITF